MASQAERDKEVLQKLLTVKDEMIWCALRPSLVRSEATDVLTRRSCARICRALIEERDALRADLASEQGEEA